MCFRETNPYASFKLNRNTKINTSFYKDSVSPITKKFYPEIVMKENKQRWAIRNDLDLKFKGK